MNLLRKHHISFKNAFNGIIWAFRTQPNFRIHFALSLLVVILGVWYKITPVEWTILVMTIVFGLGVEMVNTSIEAMTDLITTKYHENAKIAKDTAAGMMLLTAIGASLVGSLIFLPRLFSLGSF